MDKVKVSLKEARADLWLKPGSSLEAAKLRKAVVKAGFTPTWVKFEAIGQLVKQDGQVVFKVKGSEQLIPLEKTETLGELRQEALGKELAMTALIPEKKETAQIESIRVQ